MKPIVFQRFKKKSLILAYKIYPVESVEILREIKYKKLFQSVIKEDLSLCKVLEEKIISFLDIQIQKCEYLVNLYNNRIAVATWNGLIILWDLHTDKCLKTYKTGATITHLARISEFQLSIVSNKYYEN